MPKRQKKIVIEQSSDSEGGESISEDDGENLEVNLTPVKRKKGDNSNFIKPSSSSCSSLSAIATEKSIHSYNNLINASQRIQKGSKSLVSSRKVMDFDELDLNDVSDSARQVITKKIHFPTNMVGIITKCERITFTKEKHFAGKTGGEIVIDIQFIYDIEGKKLLRKIESEEINYSKSSIRFHLPKRFQEKFEALSDCSLLLWGLIMSPKHDSSKWMNSESKDKSSIPLIMLLKSKKMLEQFGLTTSSYPDLNEFKIEAENCLKEGQEIKHDAIKVLFDYFKTQAFQFQLKEDHPSNYIK